MPVDDEALKKAMARETFKLRQGIDAILHEAVETAAADPNLTEETKQHIVDDTFEKMSGPLAAFFRRVLSKAGADPRQKTSSKD